MKENNTYNEELGGSNLPDSLRVTPFSVPNDFFDIQHAQIISQLKLINLEGESFDAHKLISANYFEDLQSAIFSKIAEQDLKDKVVGEGFELPNDYFENLSDNIENRIAEERIKSIAPNLNFEVDSEYFENAEQHLSSRIWSESLRDTIGVDAGFEVPLNYFDESFNVIMSSVNLEKNISSPVSQSFDVPSGYFDELTTSVLTKVAESDNNQVKIITLPRRSNWKKYSAAAAVAMIIGVGSYFGLNNKGSFNSLNNSNASNTELNVENISDEEIISYLAQVSEGDDLIHLSKYASNNSESDHLDSQIEKKEIEEYLNYML